MPVDSITKDEIIGTPIYSVTPSGTPCLKQPNDTAASRPSQITEGNGDSVSDRQPFGLFELTNISTVVSGEPVE